MKTLLGFIAALLVAVISPILVTYYQAWEKEDAQVVSFDKHGMFFTSDSIKETVKNSNNGDIIQTVLIANEGNEDLDDLEVEIVGVSGSEITDFGDVIALHEAEVPKASIDNGRIRLHYDLLKKDETTVLWVKTASTGIPVLRSARKGLKVVGGAEEVKTAFPWDMVAIFGAILFIGLICGLLLGDALNNHVLRKVGFEPKEIRELYEKSIK